MQISCIFLKQMKLTPERKREKIYRLWVAEKF